MLKNPDGFVLSTEKGKVLTNMKKAGKERFSKPFAFLQKL